MKIRMLKLSSNYYNVSSSADKTNVFLYIDVPIFNDLMLSIISFSFFSNKYYLSNLFDISSTVSL